MCEGSVQSARVHRLVKAFVDQVSDIKKKQRTFTHGHIEVSLINQILIGSD